MESDLEALIKDRALILSEADVKSYMQMLLRALDFCHAHWVLHRDVKPNNFLIAASGARAALQVRRAAALLSQSCCLPPTVHLQCTVCSMHHAEPCMPMRLATRCPACASLHLSME